MNESISIILGISIGVVTIYNLTVSLKNKRDLLKLKSKVKSYESLYKKHLAGKIVAMKSDPDPTDEICPDVNNIQ